MIPSYCTGLTDRPIQIAAVEAAVIIELGRLAFSLHETPGFLRITLP